MWVEGREEGSLVCGRRSEAETRPPVIMRAVTFTVSHTVLVVSYRVDPLILPTSDIAQSSG